MSELKNILETFHEGHRFTEQPADNLFASRKGCLDCNEWIEPVLFLRGTKEQSIKAWSRFLAEAMHQNGTGVHYPEAHP